MSAKFSDDQKHDLCLAFVKEKLSRQDAELRFDNPNYVPGIFSFFDFVRDYSEAREMIEKCMDQLPN